MDLSETEQVNNRSIEMETIAKAIGVKVMSQNEGRYQYSTMPGMAWLAREAPIPEELLAPEPAEEPANPELAALPGGYSQSKDGGPPQGPPPGPPPGDVMADAAGEFGPEPGPGGIGEGLVLGDEPLPEEVLAAAIEDEVAQEERAQRLGV